MQTASLYCRLYFQMKRSMARGEPYESEYMFDDTAYDEPYGESIEISLLQELEVPVFLVPYFTVFEKEPEEMVVDGFDGPDLFCLQGGYRFFIYTFRSVVYE